MGVEQKVDDRIRQAREALRRLGDTSLPDFLGSLPNLFRDMKETPRQGKGRGWFVACCILLEMVADLKASNSELALKLQEASESLDQSQKRVVELEAELGLVSRPESTRCLTSGKVIFSSESGAIRSMRSKSRRLRAYHCKECYGWHLTKDAE